MRELCAENVMWRTLSRIPSVSARTGEGSVTVTSWPWLKSVWSGMYHPATHQEDKGLSSGTSSLAPLQHTHMNTHVNMHSTYHSLCDTLVWHSNEQMGMKDKRLYFAGRVHIKQFPFIAFVYLRQSWLSILVVLQKHLELQSASVAA